jgi:hypothetical protein
MNQVSVLACVAFAVGLMGCASKAPSKYGQAFVPQKKHQMKRQVAVAEAADYPFANDLDAIAKTKENKIGPNTNLLVCQLPGSNVTFLFHFLKESLTVHDGVQLGIQGLAYAVDEDYSGDPEKYDFVKDPYRIISNSTAGLIAGGAYSSGPEGITATFGKDDVDLEDHSPGYYVEIDSAKLEYVGTRKLLKTNMAFSKLSIVARYNKLSSANQIGNDVKETLVFFKNDCVGNLGNFIKDKGF